MKFHIILVRGKFSAFHFICIDQANYAVLSVLSLIVNWVFSVYVCSFCDVFLFLGVIIILFLFSSYLLVFSFYTPFSQDFMLLFSFLSLTFSLFSLSLSLLYELFPICCCCLILIKLK